MKEKLENPASVLKRIKSYIIETPLIRFSDKKIDKSIELYLKLDHLQNTGSFKIRGASNFILKSLKKGKKFKTIVAASAGNHALGVAEISRQLKIKCIIFTPKTVVKRKAELIKKLGAELKVAGDNFDDCYKLAKQHAAGLKSSVFIPAFDHPYIIEGQATAFYEIFKKTKLDALIVPVGGGGLIAGAIHAAKSLNKKIEIFGAESEAVRGFDVALKAEEPIRARSDKTIADGIAVAKIGKAPWGIIKSEKLGSFKLSEKEILSALRYLNKEIGLKVEPSASVTLAALLRYQDSFKSKKVCLFLSGGNVPEDYFK